MTISLIVALTPDRVIGRNNELPWRLSDDLKRFKRLTMGHHVVMGRKTFDSLNRPLPGRILVVISRNSSQLAARLPTDALAAESLPQAIAQCNNDPEVFIIGGGEIFREALSLATRAYVTWVAAEIDGDTFFPEFPSDDWHLLEETRLPADEKNQYPTRYCVYQRNARAK